MDCNQFHEIIERDASQKASKSELSSLADHLETCPECRDIHQAALACSKAFSALPIVEPPRDLADQIMKSIPAEKKSRVLAFPSLFRFGALAAAAVVAALLIMPLFKKTGPGPDSPLNRGVSQSGTVGGQKTSPNLDALEADTPSQPSWECSVDQITGTPAMALAGKGYRRLIPGDTLPPGSNVRTDSLSTVRLRYRDNTLVNVKPSSQVMIRVNALLLKQGSTWLQVTRKGSRFEVITPTAIAGVLGTRFGVFQSPQGSAGISVFQGKVSVTSTRGSARNDASSSGSLILQAGQRALCSSTGEMSGPLSSSPAEEEFWKNSQALPDSAVLFAPEPGGSVNSAEESMEASGACAPDAPGNSSGAEQPADRELEVHYNTMKGLDNEAQ